MDRYINALYNEFDYDLLNEIIDENTLIVISTNKNIPICYYDDTYKHRMKNFYFNNDKPRIVNLNKEDNLYTIVYYQNIKKCQKCDKIDHIFDHDVVIKVIENIEIDMLRNKIVNILIDQMIFIC